MRFRQVMGGALAAAALAATAVPAWREIRSTRGERDVPRVRTAATTVVARPAPISNLTIEASLVGAVPAAATLTVRVGNTASTRTVVPGPDFTFDVPAAPGGDMVSIELEAPGYRYASLLGSHARLLRKAGPDGRLVAAELDRVQVGPYSTAMHFFVHNELGRWPASDDEHERVLRSISWDDVATAAAWLDDLANQRAALPAGFTSGYALLQDRQAYRAFLEGASGYRRGHYVMYAPAVPIVPSRLGRNVLMLGPVPLDEPAMFQTNMRVLSQAGANWWSYAGSRRDPKFAGTVAASGEWVLTPVAAASSDVLVNKYLDPYQPTSLVLERRHIQRETYRQVFVGDRYSVWGVKTVWLALYPQYPNATPSSGVSWETFVVSRLDGLLPFRDGELTGARALPLLCSRAQPYGNLHLENCQGAVHRFDGNGTGAAEDVGARVDANGAPTPVTGTEPFSWAAGRAGPLEMTYGQTRVTHWRIDRGNEAVDTLVYVGRAPDGASSMTVAGITAMVDANVPGGLATPVGDWRHGSLDIYRAAYGYAPEAPPFQSLVTRRSDGTAARVDTIHYDPPEGTTEQTIRYGWQLVSGQLNETRYRANVSTGDPYTLGFSSCDQAYQRGATQCAPQEIRYFRPLAKVGNRWYGLQDVYSQAPPFRYAPPYVWQRGTTPNYYELQ